MPHKNKFREKVKKGKCVVDKHAKVMLQIRR